jgi:alpha-amylase/alpha-mannosidase (GH57 family)
MSFDFGPTLLRWLEREAKDTYEAILEADRQSLETNGGHGNAMAAPYHHVILPLSSRREKRTEVRWGIADFRRRFGRDPEGMWLPETAVDDETLDVLAAEGIAYTVLAPRQIENAPERGMPAAFRTEGGRTIAVFVFDGALSHDIAFGSMTREPDAWVARVASLAEKASEAEPWLLALATDGETYGHHHKGGEMALAAALEGLDGKESIRVENFGSVLTRVSPQDGATLVEPSAWSCPHGVDRWRTDCGCKMAPEEESQQRWRAPLRDALEWLAGQLDPIYEREAAPLFGDPWSTLDRYGEVASATEDDRMRFAQKATRTGRPDRAFELLELQRHRLCMFTSCAWFFDDLTGLENSYALRHAARAIELTGSESGHLESGLLEHLAKAPVNDEELRDGAELYGARIHSGWRVYPAGLSGPSGGASSST